METRNNDPMSYSDTVYFFPHLQRWSSAGFQSFIESGILSDVIEASKQEAPLSKKISDELYELFQAADMFQESTVRGAVRLTQFKRLLDEAPTTAHGQLAKFIRFFKPWCFTAGWWEANTMAWDVRDGWREKMGLDRLNPVLKNLESGIEVTFKKLGKQDIKNYPIQGYRYASSEEASQKGVSEEKWLYALVCSDQGWFLSGGSVIDKYAADLFRDGFVHDYNLKVEHIQAYVALVKV